MKKKTHQNFIHLLCISVMSNATVAVLQNKAKYKILMSVTGNR